MKKSLTLLLAFLGLVAISWIARATLISTPECTETCRLSDDFWTSDYAKLAAPECEPLELVVEVAEPHIRLNQLAPLWYRVKAKSSSCYEISDFPSAGIRELRTPLRMALIDAAGKEISLESVARLEGARELAPADIFFRPAKNLMQRAEREPLPSGASLQSAAFHYEPMRHIPSSEEVWTEGGPWIQHGFTLVQQKPAPPAPAEHPGFGALFYGRFTRPGRYALVARLQDEVTIRRRFPRFERLPRRLQHALIVAAQLVPLPIPAPPAEQFEGRRIQLDVHSSPASFEVTK